MHFEVASGLRFNSCREVLSICCEKVEVGCLFIYLYYCLSSEDSGNTKLQSLVHLFL